MSKAMVSSENGEATVGLMFVRLSRAKRLVDLMVEPMPVDKVTDHGESPDSKKRSDSRDWLRKRSAVGCREEVHPANY